MAQHRLPIRAGQQFGRLRAVSSHSNEEGAIAWCCECECGATVEVRGADLYSGRTRSCSCLQRDTVRKLNKISKTTHGRGRHGAKVKGDRTYRSWSSMLSRCSNPNDPSYADYGGRGISVTKPWRDSFEAFLNDMGERPQGRSIDRIDNRFGYFAANCRWADKFQQARNRRKPRKIRFPLAALALARREAAQ